MRPRRSLLVARPRDHVRLLDVDPELGVLLTAERRERAAQELVVRVQRVPVGAWSQPLDGRPDAGMLILAGLLTLEVAVEQRASIELLGPGDVLRPWRAGSEALLPVGVASVVRSPLTVALLGEDFSAKVSRYPEITAALIERLSNRAERLATTQAVAQLTGVERRVMALLWHLAERWGRVSPQGVVVGLALTHSMLADLIGARRPPVSTALASLARRGELLRRPDGSWLLIGDRPSAETLARRRRNRSPEPEPEPLLAHGAAAG